MKINGNINNGYQIFQENNYSESEKISPMVNEIVEQPRKVGKVSFLILLEIIGLLADVLTIMSLLNQIERDGLFNVVLTNSIIFPLLIIGMITVFVVGFGKVIYQLLTKKEFNEYVRKKYTIYRIPLKKCPICGASTGGGMKIRYVNGRKCYLCKKDIDHRWKFEYYQIDKMI